MGNCLVKVSDELFRLMRSEYCVLMECMSVGEKIIMNKEFIDKISGDTGLAISTIRNSVVSLVKKGMLLKDKKHQGIYYLNEKYFEVVKENGYSRDYIDNMFASILIDSEDD